MEKNQNRMVLSQGYKVNDPTLEFQFHEKTPELTKRDAPVRCRCEVTEIVTAALV